MAYGKGGFGGFGGGQMQQLMKQAQKMQEDIKAANEELDNAEIEGTSGGGAVKVVMNGKKILRSIKLDGAVVDPEDVEMLEDLIIAAFNDGAGKADKLYEEKLGAYSKMGGGMF
ncbi:MAG: YbaB/EbfC family nucleoid-associated protein [Clostridia bacterium]|nr:YbaB/EbfC family nucleoid-associated protein [Clostridia bacterium]